MAAPTPPKHSYLPALYAFAALHAETPYEELAAAALAAGWITRLRQVNATSTSTGNILVTFDVYVSKDGDPPELVDQVSAQVGNTPYVSLGARASLDQTLIHLFFGRLPPALPTAPTAPAAAEQQIQVPDADVVVLEDGGTYLSRDEEGLHAHHTQIEPFKPVFVNVVKGKTADGLPILADLYELGANKEDIIFAVKHTLREALEGVDNTDTLNALFQLNTKELEFVSDLGTKADIDAIKALFGARKEALTKTAPRRRTANGG